MFIKEYQCQICGKIQDKWLKNSEDKNIEPCEKCNAPPEKLQQILSSQKVKHSSWNKWSL